jgi:hypothetical protein
LADAELIFHINKSHDEILGPAHDVGNNDGHVQVIVDNQVEGTSKILPCPVHVMDSAMKVDGPLTGLNGITL